MPRGVRVVYRGDDERYSARVASFDGVKTLLGEYRSADEAGAAWDTGMRKRFPMSAISPLLNEVPAATRWPGAGEENGGELLEALLGNDAWHDVVLCGTAPGGLCNPLFCYPGTCPAFPRATSVHARANLASSMLTAWMLVLAGLAAVMIADDPSAAAPRSSSTDTAINALQSTAVHWVSQKHVRQRSMPYGHHKRAQIGDTVLACRRAAKSFHFLDAEVLDVASRRSSSGEGLAGRRSDLPVQLAYPITQLYEVMEENETPRVIARKFGLDLADLLAANKHLSQDEIHSHSKLRRGTEIVLPPFLEAAETEAAFKRHKASHSLTLDGSHWELEYLVQYMHGGQACGAVEWLCPELIFEIREQRVVVPVPVTSAGWSVPSWPTKALLVTSMLDAVSMDHFRCPKPRDAAVCHDQISMDLCAASELGPQLGTGDDSDTPRRPGCIVVGMQDAIAYRRELLPLSQTRLPASVHNTALAEKEVTRCTFWRRAVAELDDADAPRWWSPLLDNVIPLEARWTMKVNPSTAAGVFSSSGASDTGTVRGAGAGGNAGGASDGGSAFRSAKARGGGLAAADYIISWEFVDEQVGLSAGCLRPCHGRWMLATLPLDLTAIARNRASCFT